MAPAHAIQFVILSGAGTSRSEASAESKDPYVLLAQQGRFRGTLPVHSVFFLAMITNSVDRGGGRRKSWRGGNRGRLFQEADRRGHRRRTPEISAHRAQGCARTGRHASIAAAGGPFKPGFGLSGAAPQLDRLDLRRKIPTLNFAKSAKFRMGHPPLHAPLIDSSVTGSDDEHATVLRHRQHHSPHQPHF